MSFFRSLRFLHTERSMLPLWGILSLVIILCSWIVWFSYVQIPLYAVSDSARLEVDQASYPVQTPIEGTIIAVYVKSGQEVTLGTILVTLDDHSLKLRKKETTARYDSLFEQLTSVKSQMAQEKLLLAEEEKVAKIKAQEAQSRCQEKIIAAEFAEDEIKRLNTLYARGALSKIKFLRSKSEAEKKRVSADALHFALDRIRGEHEIQKKERETNLRKLNEKLLQIQGQLKESSTIIEQLECEIEKHKIKAPATGRVAEMANLHKGMFIQEGYRIGSILPTGHLKVVSFFSPSDAMGKISPGQKAYLRLKGFSWLQYKGVRAEVDKVSHEARDGRVQVDLTLVGSSPIRLQHGLPTRVEIETERITPAIMVLRKVGKLMNYYSTGRQIPLS